MVENILTKKQGGNFSLLDAGLTSASKSIVVDGLISPFANRFTRGNKILNVASKVIAGAFIGNMKGSANMNKATKIVADSMILSAGDEVVSAFLGKKTGVAVNEAFIGGDDSFGGSNKVNNESAEVFI